MKTQNVHFGERQVPIVFPLERSDLAEAISELKLAEGFPVIVLIGGGIDKKQADLTHRVIHTISTLAEDLHAVILCGGTDMGVMAEIGQVRLENKYSSPLVGIAPKELVSWPGGLFSTKFLIWGKKRWPLEAHYSHFILVPGNKFGDESPWIVDAATLLSKGHRSVTILINGGDVSRKDIELSLAIGRPVIVLSHTGRLADEYSKELNRNDLITIVPANADQLVVDAVEAILAVKKIG